MNLLKNALVSKLMLVAIMICGANVLSAQTKLYIEPQVINDYKVHQIPVILEHDGSKGTLNFDVVLSKSLQYADEKDQVEEVTVNRDFVVNDQDFTYNTAVKNGYENQQTARVTITSYNGATFSGTKGVVAYINIRAKENALDKTIEKDPQLYIVLKNIDIADPALTNKESLPAKTFDVSQVAEIKMSVANENVIANPGKTMKLILNLTNTVDVNSFRYDVIIPEGFSINKEATTLSERGSSNGGRILYYPDKKDPNNTRVMINRSGSGILFYGKEGSIMDLVLNVPETVAEDAVIKFENIEVGAKVLEDQPAKPFNGDDFTVKVVNGATAKTKADAEIAKLQKSLADSVAKIVATCPDVKDNFKGEEIAKAITALQEKVNAAYDDFTLTPKYDEIVTAPKAEIEAAIEKLVDDAEAAQKAAALDAANKKAKENADAAIKALNDAFKAAQDTIAEKCPLVADKFKGEEIAAAIAELTKNVDAALADKTLAEKYADVVETPATELKGLIETLVNEAKEAQKVADAEAKAEADRVAKNKAAYEADLAALKALEQELADTIATFDKEWTNLHLDYQANIKREIKELKKEVEAENTRVAEEGEYAYELDPSMVKAMIAEYKNRVVTSGIDSIVADEELGNARVYTIDGVQHSRLVPGVNIIVKADGTTTKVYVK